MATQMRPNLSWPRLTFVSCGVVIMSLGIALITLASLGTSAISAPMWVASLIGGPSFGVYVFLVNSSFVAVQALLLRKEFHPSRLLQIPLVALFGFGIDVWMHLVGFMSPSIWILQLAQVLLGASTLGFGIAMQIAPRSMNLSGEGLVDALAYVTGKPFPLVKVIFDTTLVASAIILSYAFLGQLEGVREGTVISAFLVGPVVRLSRYPVDRMMRAWLRRTEGKSK